jgi:ribokinase
MAEDLEEGPEIAVVGSANLDLVVEVATIPVPGETVLGGDIQRIPGGKGANQAVAAARLGRRVAMIGRVGDDDSGAILRSALTSAGVDTTNVRTTRNVPSGIALIPVAADGDNTVVVSPGANRRFSVDDVQGAAVVVGAANVVLLQLEIPIETVAAAVRCARGTVILNPAPAPPAPLPGDVLDRVDVIVPNQTELATMAGHAGLSAIGTVDPDTAVALARGLPVAAVVVTLGADGAMVVTPSDAAHIPAPTVSPVDTTAAGDAFCGALADALVGGASLMDACRWAVRVGAASTLRQGAQPSLPTREDVGRLLSA